MIWTRSSDSVPYLSQTFVTSPYWDHLRASSAVDVRLHPWRRLNVQVPEGAPRSFHSGSSSHPLGSSRISRGLSSTLLSIHHLLRMVPRPVSSHTEPHNFPKTSRYSKRISLQLSSLHRPIVASSFERISNVTVPTSHWIVPTGLPLVHDSSLSTTCMLETFFYSLIPWTSC